LPCCLTKGNQKVEVQCKNEISKNQKVAISSGFQEPLPKNLLPNNSHSPLANIAHFYEEFRSSFCLCFVKFHKFLYIEVQTTSFVFEKELCFLCILQTKHRTFSKIEVVIQKNLSKELTPLK